MSTLTRCNACTLRSIERRAAERGATVETKRMLIGHEMGGWYRVTASDEPEPVAWFLELTVECCC